MSYWHYQLMKRKSLISDEDYYAVHEYYEMNDGDGWTKNPVVVDGESIEDVKKALMLMLYDIDKYGVKDYDADQSNT